MEQAIADAGLTEDQVSNPRTGLIAGSGGPSTANMLTAFDTTREKGPKRVGPYMVPRCMSSTVSACIATFFKIKGLNFSIIGLFNLGALHFIRCRCHPQWQPGHCFRRRRGRVTGPFRSCLTHGGHVQI